MTMWWRRSLIYIILLLRSACRGSAACPPSTLSQIVKYLLTLTSNSVLVTLVYESAVTNLFLCVSPSLPRPPSRPHLALATRYTQLLLYCCVTESDTDAGVQEGSKAQWSCRQTPEALFLDWGADSQHLWGLPAISKDRSVTQETVNFWMCSTFLLRAKNIFYEDIY